MAPRGTLTLMGLLSNLYTSAGIPSSRVASRTCYHQASSGSAPVPYLLHSMYHRPSIKSGKCFSLVCSRILLTLLFKPRSAVNRFPISLSKDAPLFLEFVMANLDAQRSPQENLHLNVHFECRLNLPKLLTAYKSLSKFLSL